MRGFVGAHAGGFNTGTMGISTIGNYDVVAPSQETVDAMCRELQHCIKTHVGISTRVSILGADQIERSLVGKARRVIDKRPKIVPEMAAGAV